MGRPTIRPSKLVEQVGGSYARQLGIDLSGGAPDQIDKWFLAAILFGARISASVAMRTYAQFEREHVVSAQRLNDAGWNALVKILDRGGYVRYDFKTATKLLDVSRSLMQRHGGNLNLLHDEAQDEAELERRLKSLGKGIGDVTVNIFLRELRGVWSKANPAPSSRAIIGARLLGFIPARMRDPVRILQALKSAWRADRMPMHAFADFEAALVRYEANSRRRPNGPRKTGADRS